MRLRLAAAVVTAATAPLERAAVLDDSRSLHRVLGCTRLRSSRSPRVFIGRRHFDDADLLEKRFRFDLP